jgi:hypothetical protein
MFGFVVIRIHRAPKAARRAAALLASMPATAFDVTRR